MRGSRVHLAAGVLVALLGSLTPARPTQDNPKPPPAVAYLGGLHDFDFFAGEWHAQHHRLKERLAGSREWAEFDGTCSNRALMNGWANMDDNVFNMPGGVVRGVGLASYDAKTGHWASWWLDGSDPFHALDPRAQGRFENGLGTFYADDTLRGKPVRVRVIWSRITPTSVHWEQAFSGDAGKTWETNWITDFRRVSSPSPAADPQPKAATDLTGPHAFDSRAGRWHAHHRRLKERLAGSHEWLEFDGTQSQWPLMGGLGVTAKTANGDDNVFEMPAGAYRGVTLRAYDRQSGQWAIWWLDGRIPLGPLDPPVKGRFENGVGTFYANDPAGAVSYGERCLVRESFSSTPRSRRTPSRISLALMPPYPSTRPGRAAPR